MKSLLLALLFPLVAVSYDVTLTFDDGPSANTLKILKVLNKYKIHATFFVSAEKLDPDFVTYPPRAQILDRIVAEGHTIGSHCYYHKKHSEMTPYDIDYSIRYSLKLLNKWISPVVRLPYGDGVYDADVIKVIKRYKIKHIGWDIDSRDWDIRYHRGLIARVLSDINKSHGGIILFHDTKRYTAKNLDKIISAIMKNNRVVSLSY